MENRTPWQSVTLADIPDKRPRRFTKDQCVKWWWDWNPKDITLDLYQKVEGAWRGPIYQVDLERAASADALLDWIVQLAEKGKGAEHLLGMFDALQFAAQDRFGKCVQGIYCPGAMLRSSGPVDWVAGKVDRPPKAAPATHQEAAGFVYFIRSSGRIKAGYSANPDRRMASYRTHNPDVELLGMVPGTKATEAGLHRKLKAWHVVGEWFEDCEPVRRIVSGALGGTVEGRAD